MRTVEIRAIGRLWMPGCLCSACTVDAVTSSTKAPAAAWSKTYRVGSGPFETEITGLDDAESAMLTDSGDLSEIEDYEIVYHFARTYTKSGVIGTIHHHRSVVARPWSNPDSEWTFQELRYPAED